MNKIQLLEMLRKNATEYRKDSIASLKRNNHMNTIKDDNQLPNQEQVDAILTDFINYIGVYQGIDYALYTSDLIEK